MRMVYILMDLANMIVVPGEIREMLLIPNGLADWQATKTSKQTVSPCCTQSFGGCRIHGAIFI